MVWEADKNPSSVFLASASPEHEYDQSVVAVAKVPTLSPRSALPPESALSAGYPLTTLVVVSAAMASPEANSHL